MANTLFTNVRIFDGSGEQPFAGEVLVQGNRIARVTRTSSSVRSLPTSSASGATVNAAPPYPANTPPDGRRAAPHPASALRRAALPAENP